MGSQFSKDLGRLLQTTHNRNMETFINYDIHMSNIFQILKGTEKDLYLYDILYCVALQTIILLFSVCGPVQRAEAAPPRCVLGPGTSPCCDVQWPGPPRLWTF
mgnify:CR=1 FL=1